MSDPKIKDAEGAAAAFEAYFMRRVLAEVKGGDAMTGGGFAGGMFKEMMDEALADAMAAGGGVGLADAVERQIKEAGSGQAAEKADEISGLKFREAWTNHPSGG